ncbi:MAG: hypothetical protein ABI477_22200 [Chryseolinea sp.]
MDPEISSDQGLTTLRRKLNNQLESIKVMLIHKRTDLSPGEWENFVVRTRDCILAEPEQYLNKALPAEDVWRSIVTTLFDEFLAREKTH